MTDNALVLVDAGSPRVSIVLSPAAGEVERFAAGEVAKYLELISGAAINVGTAPAAGTISVLVGLRDQIGTVDGLPGPRAGYDGYSLLVRENVVAVAGDNPRGVLYGVYDLLERLGCRWYYPAIGGEHDEIVPRRETVDIAPLAVSEAAGFENRGVHPSSMIYTLDVEAALAQVDWAAKARYNLALFLFAGKAALPAQALEEAPANPGTPQLPTAEDFWEGTMEYETRGIAPAMRQRGMLLAGPAHCMLYFLPNELFGQHPEWFGMLDDGVRRPQGALGPEFCWSNAEAVDVFTDNVIRWLQDNRHINVFAFTPNDGGKACACEECRKSTPSDLYANIANVVVRKQRKLGLAVPVEYTGGYAPCPDPPSPGLLEPEVRVHWAHWGRNHADWYGAPTYGMRDNLDRWLGSGVYFSMVEYYTDAFATPQIHPPVATCMDRDNQWLLEKGVKGQISLMFPHGSWWAHTLNAWLGISWYYSDRHATEFLEDYARHYFGAAGEPMVEYLRILDQETWLTYYCHGTRWGAQMWMRQDEADHAAPWLGRLEALLDQAQALAVTPDDTRRLGRVVAQGRALVEMGRTRIANTTLRAAYDRAMATGDDRLETAAAMRAALDHEVAVVDPLIDRLRTDFVAVLADHESTRIVGGAATALRDDLAVIETNVPAASTV